MGSGGRRTATRAAPHLAALQLGTLLLAALGAAACAPPRERPDVLLLMVDTLRADRLGAYGHPDARTPHIDALAARGRLFLNATTPFPRTTPALGSLFTGLWPQHHGSREVGQPVVAGTSLAEVLAARGYATVGISSNGVAGGDEGLDRGFAHFVEEEELPADRAFQVTETALEAVRAVPAERPLFLWVLYQDPHYTYNPPGDFDPGAPGEACRALMQRVKDRELPKGQLQANGGGVVSDEALASCRRLYDAEIAYTDAALGRLLDGLAAEGRLRNAFVVFTSDHGENLGEADLWFEHGPSVHDASLRVPLVIAGPGVEPGRDPAPFRLEDLAPTLLGLLGVPEAQRPARDGADLSARVRGAAGADPGPGLAFAESGNALRIHYTARPYSGMGAGSHCFHDPPWSLCFRPGEEPTLHDHRRDPLLARDVAAQHPEVARRLRAASRAWQPDALRERAVRTGRFKLVEHPQLEGGWRRALYDLETDPAETTDVSALHPDVARELGAALDRWTTTLPATPPPAPDARDLEALRALGYVD